MDSLSSYIKLFIVTVLLSLMYITNANANTSQQEAFIERFYQNILGRTADSGGMSNWLDVIQNQSAAQVAMGFLNSQEFINLNLTNEEFLDIMYQTMFNRVADDGGKNDWLNKMNNGRTKQSVMFGFFQSQEFKNLTDSFGVTQILDSDRPSLSGVEAYVDRFYSLVLKRNYDESGFNDWVSQLTNQTKEPTEIASGFLFSPEYINQNEDNNTFLETCYQAFFGRASDAGGKADWLDKINNQGYTRQQVFEGFIGSQEFVNLVDGFGLDNRTILIGGQAILGPLSNATITILNLSESVLGTYTARTSLIDLDSAGKFNIEIDSSTLPSIFIVIASGGIDIDPSDESDISTTKTNNGSIHAIVTKDDLLNGDFIINPLTELMYSLVIENFGSDLSAVTKDEIVNFLNSKVQDYLTTADATYADILKFNPRFDKIDSKIPWDKMLSLVVDGIHNGESSITIANKLSVVKILAQDEGVTEDTTTNTITQIQDDDNDNRVVTSLSKAEDNTVSTFNQRYVAPNGEIVDIYASKVNDTESYLKATITKDGHQFKIEGKTSLLSGLSYAENTIANFINSLISVEISPDDADALRINIDKQLTARLSDNEVKLYIDGIEPTDEELSIINDDPIIDWNFNETKNNLSLNQIFSEYSDTVKQNLKLKKSDNNVLVFEMDLPIYYQMSGILNDSTSAVRNGYETLFSDAFFTFVGTPLGTAASLYGDASYLLNTGLPLTLEEVFSSTRIGLLGKTNNEKLVNGESYYPMLFIHSKKDDNTVLDLSIDSYYRTENNTGRAVNTNFLTKNIGTLTVNKDKGYMILLPKPITLSIFKDNNTHFFNTPSITFELKVNNSIFWVERNTTLEIDYDNLIFSDFTSSYANNTLKLDASSSISPDGTITSYIWKDKNGNQLATGKTATILYDDLIVENDSTHITLETTSLNGYTGSKTIVISNITNYQLGGNIQDEEIANTKIKIMGDIPILVYGGYSFWGKIIGNVKYFDINTNAWEFLGTDNLTESTMLNFYDIDMEISKDDIPYVFYYNYINSSEQFLKVKKYINNTWEELSSGLEIEKQCLRVNIDFSSDNTPYISYLETMGNGKYQINVKKYNGISWESVGYLTSDRIKKLSFKLINDIPYIAYSFESTLSSDNQGEFERYVYVKRFVNSRWETIGNNIGSTGTNIQTKIELAEYNNSPIVAFENYYDKEINVLKYNGVWEDMGATIYQGDNPKIASFDNVLYLAYAEKTSRIVKIKKYINNNWIEVEGTNSIEAEHGIDDLSIIFDNIGNMYITGTSASRDDETYVYKLMKGTY